MSEQFPQWLGNNVMATIGADGAILGESLGVKNVFHAPNSGVYDVELTNPVDGNNATYLANSRSILGAVWSATALSKSVVRVQWTNPAGGGTALDPIFDFLLVRKGIGGQDEVPIVPSPAPISPVFTAFDTLIFDPNTQQVIADTAAPVTPAPAATLLSATFTPPTNVQVKIDVAWAFDFAAGAGITLALLVDGTPVLPSGDDNASASPTVQSGGMTYALTNLPGDGVTPHTIELQWVTTNANAVACNATSNPTRETATMILTVTPA